MSVDHSDISSDIESCAGTSDIESSKSVSVVMSQRYSEIYEVSVYSDNTQAVFNFLVGADSLLEKFFDQDDLKQFRCLMSKFEHIGSKRILDFLDLLIREGGRYPPDRKYDDDGWTTYWTFCRSKSMLKLLKKREHWVSNYDEITQFHGITTVTKGIDHT